MEFFHSKTYYNTADEGCEKWDTKANNHCDYSMIAMLMLMIFGGAGNSGERKGEGH